MKDLTYIKHELQNLISGKSGASYDAPIQAIAKYLGGRPTSGPMAEEKHQNKPEETAKLIEFATSNSLILNDIPFENFIASGAEQRVYIDGGNTVIKLNDAIYYASWEDYFHNLLLHNFFFFDTAYALDGFFMEEEVLYAIVRQPYVQADTITDLGKVKDFLAANGFQNIKRHDYHNPQLGLIIEDLHDENVLTYEGMLYFIDTVFYIKPEQFWKPIV